MSRETTTCSVCGKPFEYLRITKPRKICSYRCELQDGRDTRMATHTGWNVVRRERVAALRGLGYPSIDRDAAASSSKAFEAAFASMGLDAATLRPDLIKKPAWPRSQSERAAERNRRYHALKALGADPDKARAGCQTSGTFERAKRELEGRAPATEVA